MKKNKQKTIPLIRKCFFQPLGLLYEPEVKAVVLTSTQVLNGLTCCDSVPKLNMTCPGDSDFILNFSVLSCLPTETLHQRPETVRKEFLPHQERLSAHQKDCNYTPRFRTQNNW